MSEIQRFTILEELDIYRINLVSNPDPQYGSFPFEIIARIPDNDE